MCSRRPSPTRKRSPRSARMGRPGWRQTAKRHTHNSRERRAHSHKTNRAEMPAPRDVEMGGSPRATTSPYLPGCGGAGMRPLKEHSAVCLARPRGGPDRAAASRPPERRSGATPHARHFRADCHTTRTATHAARTFHSSLTGRARVGSGVGSGAEGDFPRPRPRAGRRATARSSDRTCGFGLRRACLPRGTRAPSRRRRKLALCKHSFSVAGVLSQHPARDTAGRVRRWRRRRARRQGGAEVPMPS